MRDYVSSIAHLVPKVKNINKITSKKANPNFGQHFQGSIVYYDNKPERICLYTSYRDRNNPKKIKKYSTIDLLSTLAHELAHLEHWDHTPDHKHLECVILQVFMVQLKSDFYVSEEHENKNGRFY